jgi:hypothetical protein
LFFAIRIKNPIFCFLSALSASPRETVHPFFSPVLRVASRWVSRLFTPFHALQTIETKIFFPGSAEIRPAPYGQIRRRNYQ